MKLRARRLATAALECLTEHDKGFARGRGFVEPLPGVAQLATRALCAGAYEPACAICVVVAAWLLIVLVDL